MEELKVVATPPAPVQRLRAAASYPYYDFDSSLTVAKTIQDMQGGSCTNDQLALWMDYKSVKSGTFISRVSAAKQFGLIANDESGLRVTERAKQVFAPVMPEEVAAAKADAFLSVDLFSKVYEKFKGGTIPPRVGMRNLFMSSFGLSDEAADRAVRVLFDTARQTGMFSGQDETKLVRLGIFKAPTPSPSPPPSSENIQQQSVAPVAKQHSASDSHSQAGETIKPHGSGSGGSGGGVPPGVHSAIVGLLRDLPPPGAEFSKKGKQRFVKAFLATLDFVYPPTDDEDENPLA